MFNLNLLIILKEISFSQLLKPKSRVIRVMPNVTCLVNASCSVYSAGQYATTGSKNFIQLLYEIIY